MSTILLPQNKRTGTGGSIALSSAVYTAASASTVPITINAHASQSGNLVLIQEADGDDRIRVTAGGALQMILTGGQAETAIPTYGLNIWQNSAADSNLIALRNLHADGRAAVSLGNDGAASGSFMLGGSNTSTPSSITRNKIGINAGANTGLFLYTSTAAQPITFHAGSTTTSMQIEDGRVRIGASPTVNLGKFQVLGQADETQVHLRANATQTSAILNVLDSAATTTYLQVSGTGRLGVGAAASASFQLAIARVEDGNTCLRVLNTNSGANAAAGITFSAEAAGANISLWSTGASAALADRLAVSLDATCSGYTVNADQSGQDVRYYIGGSGLRLTLAATVATLAEGYNIAAGTTTGTKIGTVGGASGQKLGFFNATPIVQPLLATGGGATVDNVITALQNLGLVRQS